MGGITYDIGALIAADRNNRRKDLTQDPGQFTILSRDGAVTDPGAVHPHLRGPCVVPGGPQSG
jgi:hypothetical protein